MLKSADHWSLGLLLFTGMERKANDRVNTSGQLVCSKRIWSLRGISKKPVNQKQEIATRRKGKERERERRKERERGRKRNC